MNVLLVHNDYARHSGEEHAVEMAERVLTENGHRVSWMGASSALIAGSASQKVKAFLSGIYSVGSRRRMERLLDGSAFDLIQVQNLYPFLSP